MPRVSALEFGSMKIGKLYEFVYDNTQIELYLWNIPYRYEPADAKQVGTYGTGDTAVLLGTDYKASCIKVLVGDTAGWLPFYGDEWEEVAC